MLAVDPRLGRTFVRLSIVFGFAAGLMYPIRNLVPVPDRVGTGLFIFFGPAYLVAILGLYPFLTKPKVTVAAIIGTLFGVISGVVNMLFSVIQLENLHYIRGFIRAAETPEAKQAWRDILRGVFTVQNGLNWVGDFFLDWCVLIFAWVMWRHPKFGPLFSVAGLLAAGSHFVLKTWTFPVPPREAGLIDVGPAVSIWFSLVVIQVLRHLKWFDGTASDGVAPATAAA